MGWMVQGLNPGGNKIFLTCPEQPWGHPASCTMGTGYLSQGKAAGV